MTIVADCCGIWVWYSASSVSEAHAHCPCWVSASQKVRRAMQMLLEVQRMHDEVEECKLDVTISSNRLTRLDNPIVHDKLKALKREAEEAIKGCEE